ncbi:MAG: DctP family TRAP transporter solute-binding subunit [Propionivibrio sp.]|nr:DctP family TRAP transporter solute-binding subunit [Propionivibrio sp.]
MKRIAVAAASIALLSLLFPAAHAADYKAEYRLSTVLGTAFPWGKAAERWAELVKQKTDGRINIKLYPGASLVGGDQTREFSAIRQGVIDLAVGSSINWSPQIKQLNLFSLPFLTPDAKGLDAMLKGEVGKEIFTILDKQGVVPLAFGENGFREISNSKHAIKSPADLKGMKIRIVGSPIFIDAFTALGANPTQMSWADAQPALATKAVDGQENPLSVFSAAKLHTLGQNHLTLWGYMTDPLIFVVNKQVWANWTEADRKAVRAAAEQAGAENLIAARQGISPGDDAALKAIEKSGVTITQLTPEQRKAFKDATRPVFDKWAATIGKDLVKKAETAIAAAK